MFRSLVILLLVAAVALAAYWFFRKLTPAEKLARLQEEVGPKGGTVLKTELQGQELAFLVMDCKVFLLDLSGSKIRRAKVLEPGFYLGFTTCTGQSIKVDGEYLRASLSRTAIGAGGGNAGGGNYRSKDGRNWEKDTAKGWLPVAEAQD